MSYISTIFTRRAAASFSLIFLFYLSGAWTLNSSIWDAVYAQSKVLQVATVEREPFVVARGTGYSGYSIELWDAIADELGLSYQLQVHSTFPAMLEAVMNREADVAIANITITSERESFWTSRTPSIFLVSRLLFLPQSIRGRDGSFEQS